MTTKTIYVSIGNSDDKLTQAGWSDFCSQTQFSILQFATVRHGEWYSSSTSAWQNACTCFEVTEEQIPKLRAHLASLARSFGQDSIAWAEATTEFIKPEVNR